jgi:tetratricopeptide (TPR) repeat protein
MLSYRNEASEPDEVLLAAAYRELRDQGRARAVLARAAERFPEGALVPLATGELELDQGRYEEALTQFALSARRVPSARARAGMAAALVNIGVRRHGQGDAGGASLAFEQALDADPGSLEALRNLAILRMEAARHDEALALLERAAQMTGSDPALWRMMAEAAEAAHRPDRQEEALRRSAALAPLDPAPQASLGRLLEGQGRLREADSAYERALELGSDDPRARFRRAQRLRSVTEAQVAAGEAVRQVGALQLAAVGVLNAARGPAAAQAGAAAAAAQRRLEAARALLRDCLDLLTELRGDAASLESDLDRLLEWYPHTAALKEEAAARYAAAGRWERALALWMEVLRSDPRSAGAQAGAGSALHAVGRLEEAALFYRRALSLDAENPRRYADLALVYRALGREPQLVSLLEERALIDRHNAALAAALSRLRAPRRAGP